MWTQVPQKGMQFLLYYWKCLAFLFIFVHPRVFTQSLLFRAVFWRPFSAVLFFFWSFYHFTSLCLIYIIRVPLFCCVSFYHCTSLCFIYGIRLPLWYLRTIVRRDDFGLCSKLEEINQIIVICSNVSAKLWLPIGGGKIHQTVSPDFGPTDRD
jgi:hypothetical protein